MLELLVVSLCAGSMMSTDACEQAWIKLRSSNNEIQILDDNLNRTEAKYLSKYIDPLPDSVKYGGGAAGVIYKKQLKFSLYRGTYIDLKDRTGDQSIVVGFKVSFP